MVDSSTFNLQPTFPIASIADLAANRNVKEYNMKQQDHQDLINGLNLFGQGINSLVQRRMQVAHALAAAHLFAGTPSGQEALGTNQVGMAGQMPVIKNQTAAYDPGTGSLTPNKGPATMGDLQTAFMGVEPKDFLASMTAQKELSYKPQELTLRGREVAASEENNKLARIYQGMMTGNTIKHTANEDINALLSRRADEEKNVSSGLGAIFETDKSKQAKKNIEAIDAMLSKMGYKTTSGGQSGVGINSQSFTSKKGTAYTVNESNG